METAQSHMRQAAVGHPASSSRPFFTLIPLPFVTLAALGVPVRPVPYSRSLAGHNQYHHHLGGPLSNQPTFPSQSRLPEENSQLERGRSRPCVGPRPWRDDDEDLLPMSETPTVSGPPPSGPRNEEQQQSPLRSGIEQSAPAAASQAPETSAAPRSWETGSKRPLSWHPPPSIEPRPEPTQPRSIGVHAILNPPEGGASNAPSRQSSREVLEMPPSMSPSPQQRSSSSPLMRVSNPGTQYNIQADRPSLSPGHPPRRIITPVSPAARFASVPGKPGTVAGKVSVSQSPFVQEPSSGVYSVPSNVSLPSETTQSPSLAVSGGRILPPQPSRHSTPTFHTRRTSAGLSTNPSSQDTSPSTPHSTYTPFAQSSPSMGPGMPQPPGPSSLEPPPLFPPPTIDPLSRAPSQIGIPRYGEDPSLPGPPPDVPPPPFQGMIPVVVDFKSGSRSQAEKRKANSDASRRFRNRKKNEMAMEQKINAQAEEIRLLTEERDYYRAERDFFRESLSRAVSGPLPSRPPSPWHFRPSVGQSGSEAAKGSVMQGTSKSAGSSPATTSAAGAPPPLPTAPPNPHVSGTSTDPSAYLTATAGPRGSRDEGQMQPRPPPPGPWPPGTASGDVSGGQAQVQPAQGGYRAPPDAQQQRDSFGRSWNPSP